MHRLKSIRVPVCYLKKFNTIIFSIVLLTDSVLAIFVYRYIDWTFNKYSLERKEDIKCLLIKSFIEVFRMDAETPRLKEFSVVFNISFHNCCLTITAASLLKI